MYVVAITGGIGSGKTTVANQFAALGIEVVDADLIAREVVEPGTPALAAIASHFGPGILDEQGRLDRRALRERIFSDPAAKSWLNALLHPIIRSEMLRQCAATSSPYCLLVVPLLVSSTSVLSGEAAQTGVDARTSPVAASAARKVLRITSISLFAVVAGQATG